MFPDEGELAEAARLIRAGRLVAFPTETVYGLGANALDARAVQRIYEAKGRPATSPLIVHVSSIEAAREVSVDWPPLADVLAMRFWPGPLTLVLNKSKSIPDNVTAGLDTVGVRVPAHPVALDLLKRAGVPIAAPSANRFMHISPTTAEHVRASLGDKVDLVLDSGPTNVGIESTVVMLSGQKPTVLRPGMISLTELEAATQTAWTTASLTPDTSADGTGASLSPGLHSRHYAPSTPLVVLKAGQSLPAGRGHVLNMPGDPAAYAYRLYAALHEADRESLDWIGLAEPPDEPAWQAIRDRLRRAATRWTAGPQT
jgi:L-threonylcarbamoyladenylate synthase